jgi:hypothetical protein
MTKHTIPELANGWHVVHHSIASSSGKGSDKDLIVSTRFDGYGNAVVRFTVKDHCKETEYEKFDAAAAAYNRLP